MVSLKTVLIDWIFFRDQPQFYFHIFKWNQIWSVLNSLKWHERENFLICFKKQSKVLTQNTEKNKLSIFGI